MAVGAFPSLVATDLDGTIIRRDGTISERTVAAFARVEAAGARFVLVTGRPPRVMGSIAAAFGHRGTAICANGALTYDMRTETVEALHLIPPPALATAAAALRAAAPGIGIAVEYPDGHAADAAYQAATWDVNSSIPRLDDDALFARPASKLLGRHFGYTCDDLLALALPALDGLVSVDPLQRQGAGRGVRARGLQGHRRRRARGWLRDRAGIGASRSATCPTTCRCSAWAGTSCAVANAHPAVLAAATQSSARTTRTAWPPTWRRSFPRRSGTPSLPDLDPVIEVA